MSKIAVLTGQRFGRVVVLSEHGRSTQRRVTWKCACDCGNTTIAIGVDLRRGDKVSCGCAAKINARKRAPNMKVARPTYNGLHRRLRREIGSASEYACVDCSEPAHEWSYDHSDPDALADSTGSLYSLNPSHYEPRCHTCHRRFDQKTPSATAERTAIA